MKKYAVLLMAVVLMVALTGCSSVMKYALETDEFFSELTKPCEPERKGPYMSSACLSGLVAGVLEQTTDVVLSNGMMTPDPDAYNPAVPVADNPDQEKNLAIFNCCKGMTNLDTFLLSGGADRVVDSVTKRTSEVK